MAKIEILGKEFELDLLDAEQAGRYEKAINDFNVFFSSFDYEKEAIENGMQKAIEDYCRATFECVNAIFGSGTDRTIFGDRCNMGDCAEVIVQLSNVKLDFATELKTRFDKYLPNRQRVDK